MTNHLCRRAAALVMASIGVFALLHVSKAAAQTPITSSTEFGLATDFDKRRALGQLASHRTSLSPEQLREVVAAGLADPNAQVREAALMTVAGRLATAGSGDPAIDTAQVERPVLVLFRPQVLRFLRDPDRDVRLASIAALSGLETQSSRPGEKVRLLSVETGRALAAQYSTESDALVRAQIVNVFAWFIPAQSIEKESVALMSRALEDPAPAVLQLALVGVSNRRLAVLLPRAVGLLGHERPAIRITAAQTVSAFGAGARAYLPQLQAALAAESNEMSRKTLEGTILAITQ